MKNIEQLWEMYEESLWKEEDLKRRNQNGEESVFNIYEECTQNGISNGILRCIEKIEGDKKETWKKSFDLFCKVKGVNADTGFGFWTPISERKPKKEGMYNVTFDDGFVTSVEWYEGDWGLWADSGEVIAWMPTPERYEEKQ